MKDRLSVLVADDETLIRGKVRLMLGEYFDVGEAETAEMTRQAASNGYDAILLDIVFPDGNGIDICREIKDRDPHATIIISSSMESVDSWDQAFQAGADGYLEKRELMGLDPKKTVLMISNLVERNRLRRQAEETNLRQAELMSVLSHDVRSPFQALIGTIEMLKKRELPLDVCAKVETLHACATDQLMFINSLLEFLRLEAGAVRLRTAKMDLNLPVNQSLQALNILAINKEIALIAELEPGLPEIYGDLGRICQLVNNLVTNAIKFTQRGGKVTVSTRTAVRVDRPGVELSVDDSGVGISPEDADKILQRFRRGRSRGTEGETGAGLGLSICNEIVQLHGGALEISREKKGGALVRVWLPAAAEMGHEEISQESLAVGSPTRWGRVAAPKQSL